MSHEHDRETVVVREGGSGAGMILGIIAIILVVAAIWYFALGPGAGTFGGDQTQEGPNVNIEVPVEAPSS